MRYSLTPEKVAAVGPVLELANQIYAQMESIFGGTGAWTSQFDLLVQQAIITILTKESHD